MRIEHIQFNKGCYVFAEDMHPEHGLVGRCLAPSATMAQTHQLISEYADGVFLVKFECHPDYFKDDWTKWSNRLKKLLEHPNLELVSSIRNRRLYGRDGTEYIRDNQFEVLVQYSK